MKPQNVTLDQYISAAVNPEDKLVYIKALNGNLAKMDPKSKEAELVTTGLDAGWTYDAICCLIVSIRMCSIFVIGASIVFIAMNFLPEIMNCMQEQEKILAMRTENV